MKIYSIDKFDAINDGKTICTSAIQAAIDHCHNQGGGRVVIPSGGVYVSGTIELKSNVDLYLENGATLQASRNETDYKASHIVGEYGGNRGSFLITSNNSKNISIQGSGTIDGQAEAFMDGWWTDDGEYIRKPKEFRARIIGLIGCNNIKINDIYIKNAAQWTCQLTGCNEVVIDSVTIKNGLDIPNCDGIDPDHCKNVRISNCHIECGDDGIVIKTTKEFSEYGDSENIVILGCTIISTSSAIKIGTESHNNIRDVIVSNCIIKKSHRGLSIQLRDQGTVENIMFTNCLIETRKFHNKYWGNGEAIYITAVERHDYEEPGIVKNVICKNILFRSENGVFIVGTKHSPIKNIVLEGVQGIISKKSKFPVSNYDLRPRHSEEHGGFTPGNLGCITAHYVDGLIIRESSVKIAGEEVDHWNGFLETKDVSNLNFVENRD